MIKNNLKPVVDNNTRVGKQSSRRSINRTDCINAVKIAVECDGICHLRALGAVLENVGETGNTVAKSATHLQPPLQFYASHAIIKGVPFMKEPGATRGTISVHNHIGIMSHGSLSLAFYVFGTIETEKKGRCRLCRRMFLEPEAPRSQTHLSPVLVVIR